MAYNVSLARRSPIRERTLPTDKGQHKFTAIIYARREFNQFRVEIAWASAGDFNQPKILFVSDELRVQQTIHQS